jgi:hypothetical protein
VAFSVRYHLGGTETPAEETGGGRWLEPDEEARPPASEPRSLRRRVQGLTVTLSGQVKGPQQAWS